MLVEKPPLSSQSNTGNGIAKANYNKLKSGKAGIFRILKVQPQTVGIYNKEASSSVSIQRCTAGPGPRGLCPQNSSDAELFKEQKACKARKTKRKYVSDVNNTPRLPSEYAIVYNVRHKGYGSNERYVVR